MQTGHESAETGVDFAFDKQKEHGQKEKIKGKHEDDNKKGFFVDEELEGVEGTKLNGVKSGESVRPGAIIKFGMDDEFVDVDDPAENENGE